MARKKEGSEGDVGWDGGNTPTLTSLPSRYVKDETLSEVDRGISRSDSGKCDALRTSGRGRSQGVDQTFAAYAETIKVRALLQLHGDFGLSTVSIRYLCRDRRKVAYAIFPGNFLLA